MKSFLKGFIDGFTFAVVSMVGMPFVILGFYVGVIVQAFSFGFEKGKKS